MKCPFLKEALLKELLEVVFDKNYPVERIEKNIMEPLLKYCECKKEECPCWRKEQDGSTFDEEKNMFVPHFIGYCGRN